VLARRAPTEWAVDRRLTVLGSYPCVASTFSSDGVARIEVTVASSASSDPTSLPAFEAMARHLMAKK
jgi:hypothetical protein